MENKSEQLKPFRWGLIGAGDIVRKRVASALQDTPGSEIIAVSRKQEEQAAAFAQSLGVTKSYSRWEDLVSDPEVDGVYIATPVFMHAPMAIRAAEHGKHVLCEKPMALSVAECDAMIEACRNHNVKLGIAYYRHFYPVVKRIREIISSGRLGNVVYAHCTVFETFDVPPDHPRHWFLEKDKAGGGPMFDFGCHRIEMLMFILGDVAEVKGMMTSVKLIREVEDTAVALLRFANNALATITVSHSINTRQDLLEIFGTNASAEVLSLNEGKMVLKLPGGEVPETHLSFHNPHRPLVADFIEAVRENRDPAVSGETGKKVNEVLDALYRIDSSAGH